MQEVGFWGPTARVYHQIEPTLPAHIFISSRISFFPSPKSCNTSTHGRDGWIHSIHPTPCIISRLVTPLFPSIPKQTKQNEKTVGSASLQPGEARCGPHLPSRPRGPHDILQPLSPRPLTYRQIRHSTYIAIVSATSAKESYNLEFAC